MTKGNLLRHPPSLFAVAAACLLVLGIVFIHSSWPPPAFTRIHFATADVGQELLKISGLFGIFAFAYFIFPKIFRRPLDGRLGQLHFWGSVLALVAQLFLDYYFNVTFRTFPNESKMDTFFRAFSVSFTGFVWALYVFVAAQALFIANLLLSIFMRTRAVATRPSPGA